MITLAAMSCTPGREGGTDDDSVDSRAGASERAVTSVKGSARRCSGADPRRDVASEGLQAVGRREVAEPQHELAAAGIDERLHLLPHLLGSANEVVARILPRIA